MSRKPRFDIENYIDETVVILRLSYGGCVRE